MGLNHIRNSWIKRLAPPAVFVWLAVSFIPCVCAVAQAQVTHAQTLQTTGLHHEHCDEPGGGTSGAANDCCDDLVLRAAVDVSERMKFPVVLPSWSFMPKPAALPVVVSVAWNQGDTRDRERAPPVYLATRRLRV